MEALSERALEALASKYIAVIAILVLVLGLTLYLYFFPTTEYFKSGDTKKLPNTGRVE